MLAGLQFVRSPLVQQGPGFCGLNPLGRCHPLAAAIDQQSRRPLRSQWRRFAGGGPCHRLRLRRQLLPERHPQPCVSLRPLRLARSGRLLAAGAQLPIFDPKVSAEQIAADLGVEALVGSEGEGVWQAAWLFDARSVADAADARAARLRAWVVGEGER